MVRVVRIGLPHSDAVWRFQASPIPTFAPPTMSTRRSRTESLDTTTSASGIGDGHVHSIGARTSVPTLMDDSLLAFLSGARVVGTSTAPSRGPTAGGASSEASNLYQAASLAGSTSSVYSSISVTDFHHAAGAGRGAGAGNGFGSESLYNSPEDFVLQQQATLAAPQTLKSQLYRAASFSSIQGAEPTCMTPGGGEGRGGALVPPVAAAPVDAPTPAKPPRLRPLFRGSSVSKILDILPDGKKARKPQPPRSLYRGASVSRIAESQPSRNQPRYSTTLLSETPTQPGLYRGVSLSQISMDGDGASGAAGVAAAVATTGSSATRIVSARNKMEADMDKDVLLDEAAAAELANQARGADFTAMHRWNEEWQHILSCPLGEDERAYRLEVSYHVGLASNGTLGLTVHCLGISAGFVQRISSQSSPHCPRASVGKSHAV